MCVAMSIVFASCLLLMFFVNVSLKNGLFTIILPSALFTTRRFATCPFGSVTSGRCLSAQSTADCLIALRSVFSSRSLSSFVLISCRMRQAWQSSLAGMSLASLSSDLGQPAQAETEYGL